MTSPGSVLRSLDGLALGDAFGERFFVGDDDVAASLVSSRTLPTGPWRWTDDTAMAISVAEELLKEGTIESDRLAWRFARRYVAEPARGYGRGAHEALGAIAAGTHWSVANRRAFPDGSRGNGAAMRAAPIGACLAGRTDEIIAAARASALPTHAHPEAVDGAIAVALAADYATSVARRHERGLLLMAVVTALPDGPVRRGIERAREGSEWTPIQAAAALGSGRRVSAADTVPFALWCADRHLASYEDAMWATVAGLGDRDTTCAIVGGIVAANADVVLPPAWIDRRESLPSLGG